ncbi:MAG: ECF transporter S component [Oscillibacter sp.]|nr:ECF transporter S component [Oscillibacter sp.]
MKSVASKRVLYITETAVMTALLIVLQYVTKPAGQYVTGSCVNAVLAVSVLAVGLWSGITVALLSPFFAFLLGIGPQLFPITPSIAVGNLVFVLLLFLLAGGKDLPLWRKGVAWVVAAVAKFAVLYALVVKILCVVLTLKEAQIATFTVMFSYPQLITALVGGGIALLLTPLLRRALKR